MKLSWNEIQRSDYGIAENVVFGSESCWSIGKGYWEIKKGDNV